MLTFPEYETFDAVGLAALIRRGDIAPEVVLTAAIERMDARNAAVGAVVHRMDEEARRTLAARVAGPFAGVPYLLKDLNVLYAGQPTRNGSRSFETYLADHDSTIVRRLKAAGLIIAGKTTTPEYGVGPCAEPAAQNIVARNPWDLSRTPGGSSSGAAAAVAVGMVPAAHATDGGGSIRIPASWCGLFGLKPTRARNPVGPDVGEGWSGLGVGHAITRSVRDAAALLDATHGPEPGAPYVAPAPVRPFLEEVAIPPGRLRIGVARTSPTGTRLHPDVVAATDAAAQLCAGLGHIVEEAVPDLDGWAMAWAYRLVIGANLANLVDQRGNALGKPLGAGDVEPVTRMWADEGRRRSAVEYTRMTQIIHAIGRQLAAFFARYDVLLSPTVGEPPLPIGEISMQNGNLDSYIAQVWNLIPFTLPINFAGTPAATLPLHWSAGGLPIGVQIATRFGDEATIFRLAGQLEQARPWFNRRPPTTAAGAGGSTSSGAS